MSKKFDIPKLNQESWDSIQDALDNMGHILSAMELDETDYQKKQQLEVLSIYLGMLDVYLGRSYTLEELEKEMSILKLQPISERKH